MNTRIFPTILIALDTLAAAAYAMHGPGEWRKICCWLAAALLTFCVTY